jgi:gas vesicle structural protein
MRENVAILNTSGSKEVSLLEVLDHVVNKGVLIQGSIVISLAGVDLIYLGLNVVLTSVETALRYMERGAPPPSRNGNRGKD